MDGDSEIDAPLLQNEQGEDSPIEQVALTVPVTDDPSLPVFTFRTWILGTLACLLLSFLNQFFWYRREPLSMTAISAQIAVVPLGHVMAATVTKRVFLKGKRWEFTLNPGKFNVKEHVLITIFANSGAASVYAIHFVSAVKVFYRKEITVLVAFLVVITTHLLGFCWARLFRRYLVEPAALWWPQNRRMRLAPSLLTVTPSFLYVKIINLYTKKDGTAPNKEGANLIHPKISFRSRFLDKLKISPAKQC